MEIIGNIYSRGPVEQKRDNFKVQEFMLDASYVDNYTQEERENFVKFQVTNKNIEKLEAIPDGSRVKVFFGVSGRFYSKDDGSRGHAQNLTAFNFEVIKKAAINPSTENCVY